VYFAGPDKHGPRIRLRRFANSVGWFDGERNERTTTQAVVVNQSQAADAVNINVTNGSGTATNALLVAKSGAGALTYGLAFSALSARTLTRASGTLS